MRLLLVTFVLDEQDAVLGWQARVAKELAGRVERLFVLTSTKGLVHGMPGNMEVVVPPTRPLGLPHRFGGRWAFNWHVYALCRRWRVEAVFVHMAMEWAYQLYPAFRLLRLPVVLWYAHGAVSRRLRAAVRCVDRVVTSTPEGCRLRSEKIRVIGQAIDTDRFHIPRERALRTVLYVGRITARKRVDLLYRCARALFASGEADEVCFEIVGPARTIDDIRYEGRLRAAVWEDRMENRFRMIGFVPSRRLPEFYDRAFLHLNVSATGSMDKTVMEALAAGCPVLTSNEAFFDLLRGYPEFIIDDERPQAVAERILHIYRHRETYDPQKLRRLVTSGHDIGSYADRVLSVVQEAMREKCARCAS